MVLAESLTTAGGCLRWSRLTAEGLGLDLGRGRGRGRGRLE